MDGLSEMYLSRHTAGLAGVLGSARVGIAGCGGLGSNCAMALARSGIGLLVIADFDVVEPSNLNRQAFMIDQLGKPKAEMLRQNIVSASPVTTVESYQMTLTAENIPKVFSGCAIVVEAFDRADQKTMLIETVASKMPGAWCVAASGIAGIGSLETLKVQRFGRLIMVGDGVTEPGPETMLLAPRVTVAACMQADVVLQILTGVIR